MILVSSLVSMRRMIGSFWCFDCIRMIFIVCSAEFIFSVKDIIMTIGFSQKNKDNSPNFFVSKIIASFFRPEFQKIFPVGFYSHLADDFEAKFGKPFDGYGRLSDYPAKIHTIRRDENNRWKVGNKIHFVINNRTKDRFQFAPVLSVKKIQKIEVKYLSITKEPIDLNPMVWIDGYLFFDAATGVDKGIELLARNDGFESVERFFDWFSDDFEGKIIHWTDFSYL